MLHSRLVWHTAPCDANPNAFRAKAVSCRCHVAFCDWSPAEAAFDSAGGIDPGVTGARRLHHHREAFVSSVDGVLAMRLSCEEEGSGKGCVRRVLAGGSVALGVRRLGVVFDWR